ncbi:hypothetical protein E2C01_081712 [Portunus trituberculatus]|uniref:Uncharacterized protein n=1 Tax=Portunus trituberculatus TaxID=210409 RepID=A0A5B7J325_PORTR|nr:hypothetical protein [Portunus trituberculatus]
MTNTRLLLSCHIPWNTGTPLLTPPLPFWAMCHFATRSLALESDAEPLSVFDLVLSWLRQFVVDICKGGGRLAEAVVVVVVAGMAEVVLGRKHVTAPPNNLLNESRH